MNRCYGSNISSLAVAAPMAGHFNSFTDPDGVVRSVPLVAHYKNAYFESLSLAMFRAIVGMPRITPSSPKRHFFPRHFRVWTKCCWYKGTKPLEYRLTDVAVHLFHFVGPEMPKGDPFNMCLLLMSYKTALRRGS